MNTPSNAGKELLPCPFCGGLPLVNYERIVCEDCRIGSEPEQPGCSILSLTDRWNRRTTPPTQSQEGEPFDGQPEKQATYWRERYEIDHGELLIAQRENDRLRSEVAGLKADAERYQFLRRFDHFAHVDALLDGPCNTLDEAVATARAATEEGKRG